MADTTPVMLQGKYKVLLFRNMKDTSVNASKLVFQTEHTFSYNREMDAITTKDGKVIKVGELEAEVEINAILARQDPTAEMLQNAMIEGERLELWEVNIDPELEDEEGKFPAVYCQGYLENWEPVSSSEDEAEISSTFRVDRKPQFGRATMTEEQKEAAQYAFRDTIADDGIGGGVEG